MMLASKTPRDLNGDPEPWRYFDGTRRSEPMNQHSENPYRVLWDHLPRPEFDHPQHNGANPVLAAVRASTVTPEEWHVAVFSAEIYGGFRAWEAPAHPFHVLTTVGDEYLDHAERVLDRLVRAREEWS